MIFLHDSIEDYGIDLENCFGSISIFQTGFLRGYLYSRADEGREAEERYFLGTLPG